MITHTLKEMITCLRDVSDIAWGRYAFKNEMLKDKIPVERRDEMTRDAMICGEQWAQRMIMQTNTTDAQTMLESLGLELAEKDMDMLKMPRQLFAQYIPDKRVEIMTQPISLYSEMYEPEFPEPAQVRSLLIAHEMFHYIEELNKDEIYSRTEKVCLWKIFNFKWESTVRTVGEIAAMSFAKKLTGADYSPYMLDIILLYSYKADLAVRVFQRIMEISKEVDSE